MDNTPYIFETHRVDSTTLSFVNLAMFLGEISRSHPSPTTHRSGISQGAQRWISSRNSQASVADLSPPFSNVSVNLHRLRVTFALSTNPSLSSFHHLKIHMLVEFPMDSNYPVMPIFYCGHATNRSIEVFFRPHLMAKPFYLLVGFSWFNQSSHSLLLKSNHLS